MSFDHHALVASTAAMKAAGISKDSPDPPRGIIERAAGPGSEPTGLLLEHACMMVRRAAPAPSAERYRQFVRTALEDLASRGFVEVHDMLATPRLADALLALEREGELRLRVWLYALRPEFTELIEQSERWRTDMVRLAGLKIFTDGTLSSRTAFMLHPYREPIPGHPRGSELMSIDDICESLRFADDRGYAVAAHAIGDGAVRNMLDAIERVQPETLGQRIEHAQFIDEADVPRFAALGVIASMQPCHLLTDIEAIRRFAPHREARAFPLAELIEASRDSGFDPPDLLWLGSDSPIVPPSPQDNVQAAVHRRRDGMHERDAIAPRQAIDEPTALACMRSQDDPTEDAPGFGSDEDFAGAFDELDDPDLTPDADASEDDGPPASGSRGPSNN
jgi:hypothetical protein